MREKKITLGSKNVKDFVGWSALVNALLVEHVIGLRRLGGAWSIEPHLPATWMEQGKETSITLPFHGLDVTLRPGGDGIHVSARRGETKKDVHVPNHGHVVLA